MLVWRQIVRTLRADARIWLEYDGVEWFWIED